MDFRPTRLVRLLAITLLLFAFGAPAYSSTLSLTKNHQLWDSGPDILALQQFLNSDGFVVAQAGAGPPGHETNIFGPRTQQWAYSRQRTGCQRPAFLDR
jgi:hypothetical protein